MHSYTLERSQHPVNVKLLLELKIKLGNLWGKEKKNKPKPKTYEEELLNLKYYLQLGGSPS